MLAYIGDALITLMAAVLGCSGVKDWSHSNDVGQ